MGEEDDPVVADEFVEIDRACCGLGLEVGCRGAEPEAGGEMLVFSCLTCLPLSRRGRRKLLVRVPVYLFAPHGSFLSCGSSPSKLSRGRRASAAGGSLRCGAFLSHAFDFQLDAWMFSYQDGQQARAVDVHSKVELQEA